jgi:ubiquinone/menaquinone biosynthesis C-methylase UbiE
MLKAELREVQRGGIARVVEGDGRRRRFRPWIGGPFAFIYDFTMKRHVFWRQFGTDIDRHEAILNELLSGVHGWRVLEIAAGTGSAAGFLPPDNRYTGTDISPGLLKRAVKRFRKAGFTEARFYVADAGELPFAEESFDLCLCFLSLNFFPDIPASVGEAARVLRQGGIYIGAVPVPERKPQGSTIRGTLLSAGQLAELFESSGFEFSAHPAENGALLYFTALRAPAAHS